MDETHFKTRVHESHKFSLIYCFDLRSSEINVNWLENLTYKFVVTFISQHLCTLVQK
jgi:hypothetical protein